MINWIPFYQWVLLTEAPVSTSKAVTHLTHVEELPILFPTTGAEQAYTMLDSMRDLLKGHAAAPINLSVKIDGAPTIVVGRDPEDNKFFVATKGPSRIAKSTEDIERLFGEKPGLRAIMSLAFGLLQPLSWPQILQGDVVFTPELKQPKIIDGISYITFTPNTITYAVPANSPLGRQVIAASLGIAFHTTYTGSSLKTLQSDPGADVEPLNPPPSVVFISSNYRDLSGTVTLTDTETTALTAIVTQIQTQTARLKNNAFLRLCASLPIVRNSFIQFQNSLVKANKPITLTPQTFTPQFLAFLRDLEEKESQTRSTESGRTNVANKYESLRQSISDVEDAIVDVLIWQQLVIDAKLSLLKKLHTTERLRTFYTSDEGVVAGPHEGFVAVDNKGQMVKLVDRSTFSRLNFTRGRFRTETESSQ